MSRLIIPSSGSITIGDKRLNELPEAITGKRLGYVGPTTFMFNGTVFDNLTYALKHQPVANESRDADKEIAHARQLSVQAGNTPNRFDDDWIDYEELGFDSHEALVARIIEILEKVELDDEIYQVGLLSLVDQADNSDLADRVMQARRQLRDKFTEPAVARLVEPFDHEQYNNNMSVAENLLFGTVYSDEFDADSLVDHPAISQVLKETGLIQDFIAYGIQIAEIMIDLFSDVEPDSELFEQFSFISADDLPEFNKLLMHARENGTDNLSDDDRRRLMSLPFKLIPARHRLGLITDDFRNRVLEARKRIHEIAQSEDLGIEFLNEAQYNPRISIQDNILFGKLAYGQANVQQKINALIADVVDALDLRKDIIEAGLNYEVGVGGGRLSTAQRQKLGLARVLLKAPDLLIVNEALSSLDQATERRLIGNVRQLMESRGILWTLGRVQLADNFDSVMVMERGRMIDSGGYDEIASRSEHFRQLLASE